MASLGLFYDLREHYWAKNTRTKVVARRNNSHARRLIAGGYITLRLPVTLWLSMTVAQRNYVAQQNFVAQKGLSGLVWNFYRYSTLDLFLQPCLLLELCWVAESQR